MLENYTSQVVSGAVAKHTVRNGASKQKKSEKYEHCNRFEPGRSRKIQALVARDPRSADLSEANGATGPQINPTSALPSAPQAGIRRHLFTRKRAGQEEEPNLTEPRNVKLVQLSLHHACC